MSDKVHRPDHTKSREEQLKGISDFFDSLREPIEEKRELNNKRIALKLAAKERL